MQVLADFELVRVALGLAMFGCACYFDVRSRSVSDLLWIIFAGAAGITYIFDFPSSWNEGVATIASIALAQSRQVALTEQQFLRAAVSRPRSKCPCH